ncbi:hypothetical protein [Microtetraspora malaysiensis]|uniref:Uncharacterized protein n=1 Tax=Microtetraspora malaysiensis TaxID=161358 RepID=A0ABW6SWK4_9ACTN
MSEQDKLQFPASFRQAFTYGSSGAGYFGTDVLHGLIKGMDDFLANQDRLWSRSRSLGPALLGCVPWFDDPELLDRVTRFPSACVMVTKQEMRKRGRVGFEELKRHTDQGPGFPAQAFSALTDLASRYEGDPPLLYPTSPEPPAVRIQTFRSFGFRKSGSTPVPILHAKLFLLGELWWHDEHPEGFVADIVGFTPMRLWLGSANGTKSSRLSLEFGLWVDDRELLVHAQEFLIQLLRHSEGIDPDDDQFAPEFVPLDYDDETFWEYYRDLDPEVDPGDE